MKRIIIIIFFLIFLYCIYGICPNYKFSKHQIGNCGMLTVLTYNSIFNNKIRTYFIAGNYNSLRLPKDCFYTEYGGGFSGGYQLLSSCRDGKIVLTHAFGYFEINGQHISNYMSDKIILEEISYSKFTELQKSGEYLLLYGD